MLEPATERRAELCRHAAQTLLALRQAAALRIEAPFPTVRGPMSSLCPKRASADAAARHMLGDNGAETAGIAPPPKLPANEPKLGAEKSGLLHLRAGGPIFLPSTVCIQIHMHMHIRIHIHIYTFMYSIYTSRCIFIRWLFI